MTTYPDLINLFEEYKELVQPVSPPGYPTKASADNALDYLQFQFEETAHSVFLEFIQRWLGENFSNHLLSLRDVAYYYDFNLATHQDTVNFLDSNIAADTYKRVVKIWYGKDEWNPPSNWVHPYLRLNPDFYRPPTFPNF
jgi:hypothetical protein